MADLQTCGGLEELEGREYYGEFTPETDPMGSDKENPVSHLSYSYSAQVAALDEEGRIKKITAAVDLGIPININAAEGQIEGGIVMGLGMALTEDLKITDCRPKARFGTLGVLRATQVPDIEVKLVRSDAVLDHSYGAKGVGELCLIPTAPAVSGAYYKYDGKIRLTLPMEYTFYSKKGGK
ncbi:MAG: molybdopterin-dependent oxidoreductase, partial [Oscillospiraceae bacterium]|nr:molybdopterin-dependent oxidoreductase [Oscillospiraceae bacterium]